MSYDFGEWVRGTVADENDWSATGPRIIRPRREVTGGVVGLYATTPSVARIETSGGERLCVRVTGRIGRPPASTPAVPSLVCPSCGAADYSLTRGCAGCGLSMHEAG